MIVILWRLCIVLTALAIGLALAGLERVAVAPLFVAFILFAIAFACEARR